MSQGFRQTILALETAVGGGSIDVFQNGVEIASICGAKGISRAEDLITNIDQLLNSSGIASHDIDTVAVSTGPGSYTGIRIGISTAMGLAESLGASFIGVDLLTAMGDAVNGETSIVSAVPIGRDEVAWCVHNDRKGCDTSDPHIGTISDFLSNVLETQVSVAILHRSLIAVIGNMNFEFAIPLKLVDAGENLATFIGRSASLNRGSQDIKPLYLLNPARRSGLF